MKKRQWSIRRSTIETPDAPRRWDQAYQQLLQESTPSLSLFTQKSLQQEHFHEYRGLRPRFDTTTSTSTDDRTTTRTSSRIVSDSGVAMAGGTYLP